jgi:hypothetical protein
MSAEGLVGFFSFFKNEHSDNTSSKNKINKVSS